MAQPPAPAIAGPDMEAHFPGNAPGRARQTQQKRRQNSVRQRALTLMHQGVGEAVAGALAPAAPVAFAPWPAVVIAPRIDVLALATGTLQRVISTSTRTSCCGEIASDMRGEASHCYRVFTLLQAAKNCAMVIGGGNNTAFGAVGRDEAQNQCPLRTPAAPCRIRCRERYRCR